MSVERAEDLLPRSDVVRRRMRARAAEERLSHVQIAERLSHLGLPMSRRKVSTVIAGEVRPVLDELRLWASVLNTSELYLLGFTYDPRPDGLAGAAIVAAHTPGLLNQQIRRLTLVPNTGTSLPQTVRRLSAVPDR